MSNSIDRDWTTNPRANKRMPEGREPGVLLRTMEDEELVELRTVILGHISKGIHAHATLRLINREINFRSTGIVN